MNRQKLFSLLLLLLGFVVRSSAQCPGGPGTEAMTGLLADGNQGFTGLLGTDFTVNSSITITKLGAYADNGAINPANAGYTDARGTGIRVGIYDRTNNAFVAGLDALINDADGSPVGGFIYEDIPDVVLAPGEYAVISLGFNSVQENGNTNASAIPAPTYNAGAGNAVSYNYTAGPRVRYASTMAWGYPTTTADGPSFYAGNFEFCSAVGPVINTTKVPNVSYATIQAAIDDADPDDVISVLAKATPYVEDITIDKPLTLEGPNANISGCAAGRNQEAIIQPATSSFLSSVITVLADDVTISGFTIDGDNTAITSGTPGTAPSTDLDAADGIVVLASYYNVDVANNIIKNVYLAGVELLGTGTPTSGHDISGNKMQDIGSYGYTVDPTYNELGEGVYLYNNMYAAVVNNCMDNVHVGVQTFQFDDPNLGTTPQSITGNTITNARRAGIWLNDFSDDASGYTLSGNTITGASSGDETRWDGISITAMNGVLATATNNIISIGAVTNQVSDGYDVWNVASSVPAVISGGTVTGVDRGVFVNNYDNENFDAGNGTHAAVSNITITPKTSGTGIRVYDNPAATTNTATVQLSIGAGVVVTGGTDGLVIENDGASVTALGNVAFSGQTDDYIELINNANNLNATTATFGGVDGATASNPQNFAIEDKIEHKIDNGALGFVTVKANNAFVNDIAAPTATNNDYTRIDNGVHAVGDNWTINLSGTFDWVETNAQTSWALGSDGVASTIDDYSVDVPADLEGVTFTAPTGHTASITGPGDLATSLYGEYGISFYNNGENQDWTISNITFSGIENAIGMFYLGPAASPFSGTVVTGNTINIPTDVVDGVHNIGIHYAHGANQTFSNNTFNIPAGSAANGEFGIVAMQCNTSGGAVYDGLSITDNTFNVTGASSTPQFIVGLWENAHAHSSDITISNNSFLSNAAGNDPAANQQTAFVITSHSSASTTVAYNGNTVEGANIGFEWLDYPSGQPNFAGNQPVLLSANSATDGGTGVLVRNNGVANIQNNFITGNVNGIIVNDGSTVEAENNNLSNNSNKAIDNNGTVEVEAECNWYGTATNLSADVATKIEGSVDYSPYLVNGTDDDNNAANGFQPVAGSCVGDNEPPTYTTACPGPTITERTGANNPACEQIVNFTPPAFAGNTTFVGPIPSNRTPGSAFPVGTTTVTYQAGDEYGNTTTCSFTVTVIDNTEPEITVQCPADIEVFTQGNSCTQTASWTEPEATDNCGQVIRTSSHTPGQEFPLGPTTVTYTFRDASTDGENNTTTCSFVVTVTDGAPPQVFDCPPPTISVETGPNNVDCGEAAFWDEPYATDACSGPVSVIRSHAPGDIFPVGPTTVTYTFVDASTDATNNTSICSFVVQVTDNTDPVLTCPGNQQLNTAAGVCTASYTIADPLFDNCPGATWTYTLSGATQSNTSTAIADNAAGSGAISFNKGTTTVTLNATDGTNNTSCSFTVEVSDNQAPVLTCPGNQQLNTAAGVCTASYTIDNPISDNCTGATWTYTINGVTSAPIAEGTGSGALTFNQGTTTVTLNATDGTNNTSCSFTVEVSDNQAPVLTCPGNQQLNTAAGVCTASYTIDNPISDNCTGATWTYTINGVTSAPIAEGTGSGALTFNQGTTTVTLNATDGTNNTSCSFDVVVSDNQTPMLACPGNQQLPTAAGVCTASYEIVDPVSDNCGATWTYTLSGATQSNTSTAIADNVGSGALTFNKGTTTVTLTATDGVNNTSCSFDVVVSDNQAPVVACPGPQTVLISSTNTNTCVGTYTIPDLVSDNCPGVTWTYTLSGATQSNTSTAIADNTTSGALTFNKGTTVVTITATDGVNNSSCSYNVVVVDDVAPIVSGCPNAPIVVYTAADATTCGAVVQWAPITAADNCNLVTTARSTTAPGFTSPTQIVSGATFPVGVWTVTYTFTDGSTDALNNTSTCTFTVDVRDGTPPTYNCPPNVTVATSPGSTSCSQVATWQEPTRDDNCGTVITTSSHNSGDVFPLGTTTVTYTFVDGSTDPEGNTSTCSFTVTVTDGTTPVLTCPGNVALNTAPGTCAASYTIADPVSDNCPGATWTYTLSGATQSNTSTAIADNAAGSGAISFNKGTTTVTLNATDGTNNTSCSFTVTVTDNQTPMLACPGNQQLNTAAGACTASYTIADPVSDNCTGATWTYTINGVTSAPIADGTGSGALTFNQGTTTVTLNATDGTNNTSCSFTVTVTDDEDPVLACPANVSLTTIGTTCAANYQIPSVVTDNCTGAITWTYTINGVTSAPIAAGTGSGNVSFNTGATTVTLNATDAAGNTAASCSFTVTVTDNTPPTIACPSPVALNTAAGFCTASYTINDPVTNDCPGATWSYTLSGATNAPAVTRNDNQNSVPVTFNKGITTVTLNATDGTNNTSCSFTVTVSDNEAPTVACPGPQTVLISSTNTNTCVGTYTIPDVVGDNCPGVTWSYSTTGATTLSGSGIADGQSSAALTLNKGTTVVTITALDAANNSNTCSYNVVVVDDVAPIVSGCPTAPIVVYTAADATTCGAVVEWDPITATDNCNTVTTARSTTAPGFTDPNQIVSGATFPRGVWTVTYTFTDGSTDALNNTSTCTFTVDVRDGTPPTYTCPGNLTFFTGPGNTSCSQVATWQEPTRNDNCGTVTTTSSHNPGDVFPVGTTTVTYTFVDGSTDPEGNTSTCSFTVTVVDNTAPTLTCPGNQQLNTAAGACTASYTIADPITSVCPGATWTYTLSGATQSNTSTAIADNAGSGAISFNKGTTTVTLNATDGTNNTSCSFTVTVSDNQTPTLACPGNQQLPTAAGACTASYTILDPISDNCTGATWTYTLSGATQSNTSTAIADNSAGSGAISFNKGITTVTLNATDGTNNTSCSFTVTVSDNQAPVLACPGNQQLNTAAGACTASYTIDDPVSDNCTGATWTYTINGVTSAPIADGTGSGALTFNQGTTTVTLNATDGTNNTSCSFTVTVTDNQTPVLTCPGNQTFTALPGGCTVNYTIQDPISDNCTGATWTYSINGGTPSAAIADGNNATLSFSNGTNTVTLTATDGVNNTSCTFTVTVGVAPCAITVTPSNNTYTGGNPRVIYIGYGPQSATLQASPNGPGYQYSWAGPTQYLSNTNTSNPTFNSNVPGNYVYTVTVTNPNGCSTTCTVEMCVRDIRVVGSVPVGGRQKVWMCREDDQNQIQVLPSQVPSNLAPQGDYRLGPCNMTECFPNSPQSVRTATPSGEQGDGINPMTAAEPISMTVFPNPTTSDFKLVIESTSAEAADVRILDLSGRVLQRLPATPTNVEVTLGRELAAGVYFIEVRSGDELKMMRVVKQ